MGRWQQGEDAAQLSDAAAGIAAAALACGRSRHIQTSFRSYTAPPTMSAYLICLLLLLLVSLRPCKVVQLFSPVGLCRTLASAAAASRLFGTLGLGPALCLAPLRLGLHIWQGGKSTGDTMRHCQAHAQTIITAGLQPERGMQQAARQGVEASIHHHPCGRTWRCRSSSFCACSSSCRSSSRLPVSLAAAYG